MVEVKREIIFDEVKRGAHDEHSGIFLLAERILENNKNLPEEEKVKCKPLVRDGKNSLDIQLPSGVAFQVEDGHISVSDFGLSSAQIKDLRHFFYMNGIENFSLPNEEDVEFKEKMEQAERELAAEPVSEFSGIREETPHSNDNNASEETNENSSMNSEELLAHKKSLLKCVKNMRKEKYNDNINYGKPKDKVYPSKEAILQAFQDHIDGTHKEQSGNYRLRDCGSGYELVFYTDADQKKQGATEDKNGRVSPNYQFALRGEVFKDGSGNPRLSITFMTPKYGRMEGWMFDEVANLASANKITHLRYKAGLQHKSEFFNACAKKMIIPTGVKLKKKDVEDMIAVAKKNNDKTADRKQYYLRLAAQLEENMINENTFADEGHPFHKIVKQLRDDARSEEVVAKSEMKFKKFNQFFENNIMDKFFEDKSNKTTAEPDAVKELAMGNAYLRFLNEYKKDDTLVNISDEERMDVFKKYYDEEVYRTDKRLSTLLGDLYRKNDSESIERRDKLLTSEYNRLEKKIKKTCYNIKSDFGVDVDVFNLQNSEYIPTGPDGKNPNANRIARGRQLVEGQKTLPTQALAAARSR